jgi:hypothetical protein
MGNLTQRCDVAKNLYGQTYTYRICSLSNDSLFGNPNHSRAPSLPTAATASCAFSSGFRMVALPLRAGGAIAAAYTSCPKSRGGVLNSYRHEDKMPHLPIRRVLIYR